MSAPTDSGEISRGDIARVIALTLIAGLLALAIVTVLGSMAPALERLVLGGGRMTRQLQLPGLPKATHTPVRPRHHAKRDYNAAEFERALARAGFRPAVGGTAFVDVETLARYAGVFRANPIRLARRATLARIIRLRAQATRSSATTSAGEQPPRLAFSPNSQPGGAGHPAPIELPRFLERSGP